MRILKKLVLNVSLNGKIVGTCIPCPHVPAALDGSEDGLVIYDMSFPFTYCRESSSLPAGEKNRNANFWTS